MPAGMLLERSFRTIYGWVLVQSLPLLLAIFEIPQGEHPDSRPVGKQAVIMQVREAQSVSPSDRANLWALCLAHFRSIQPM